MQCIPPVIITKYTQSHGRSADAKAAAPPTPDTAPCMWSGLSGSRSGTDGASFPRRPGTADAEMKVTPGGSYQMLLFFFFFSSRRLPCIHVYLLRMHNTTSTFLVSVFAVQVILLHPPPTPPSTQFYLFIIIIIIIKNMQLFASPQTTYAAVFMQIDYLVFLPPVDHEGSYQGETKCVATTSEILMDCLGLTRVTVYHRGTHTPTPSDTHTH